MPIFWKIQKTVEAPQGQLWTVPRILIVEGLPEMGQRQAQTEKIQKTVAKTPGQIATNIFRSPRRSRSLSRYHELFRD